MTNHNSAIIIRELEKLLDSRITNLLQRSDSDEFRQIVEGLVTQNSCLEKQLSRLREENIILACRIENMELKERRNNIVTHGLDLSGGKVGSAKHAVEEIVKEIVGPNVDLAVVRAYPLGIPKVKQRPILAELSNPDAMDKLLKSPHIGRKSDGGLKMLCIKRDLPLRMRIRQAKFLRLRWEIKNKFPNRDDKIRIRGGRMFVEDEVF